MISIPETVRLSRIPMVMVTQTIQTPILTAMVSQTIQTPHLAATAAAVVMMVGVMTAAVTMTAAVMTMVAVVKTLAAVNCLPGRLIVMVIASLTIKTQTMMVTAA